jgi:hypothetical protein
MKYSEAVWMALFITLICLAAGFVVFALVADVDSAGAADECWHGCPPLRPQLWMPIVQQCRGQWCDYGGWTNELPVK